MAKSSSSAATKRNNHHRHPPPPPPPPQHQPQTPSTRRQNLLQLVATTASATAAAHSFLTNHDLILHPSQTLNLESTISACIVMLIMLFGSRKSETVASLGTISDQQMKPLLPFCFEESHLTVWFLGGMKNVMRGLCLLDCIMVVFDGSMILAMQMSHKSSVEWYKKGRPLSSSIT
ncbi:hypothetical protein R6Q59_021082 [Mikania micrantha]